MSSAPPQPVYSCFSLLFISGLRLDLGFCVRGASGWQKMGGDHEIPTSLTYHPRRQLTSMSHHCTLHFISVQRSLGGRRQVTIVVLLYGPTTGHPGVGAHANDWAGGRSWPGDAQRRSNFVQHHFVGREKEKRGVSLVLCVLVAKCRCPSGQLRKLVVVPRGPYGSVGAHS